MEGRVRGSFPGGPSKSEPAAERTSAPRLRSVRDLADRAVERQFGRGRVRRRNRLMYGFLVAAVTSAGIGFYLGMQRVTTVEQVRAENASASESSGDLDISSEMNKAMMELWRMEDVEFMRNRRE